MYRLILHILFLLFAISISHVQAQKPDPDLIDRIGLDQKLGGQVPLGLSFTNELGEKIQLSQLISDKPVVLTLVYYECPMLCNQVLNSLLRALNVLTFDIGTEFEVVTVSIDPGETHALAAQKKAEYLKNYRGNDAALGWHFLTGEQDQITQLAQAVGFRYEYEEKTDQYVHASGIIVLTPDGRIARYYYGIDFPPRDLRWGLVEAADGEIGNPVDQLLLLCYTYDPLTGKYGLFVRNSLRIGAIATVLALGTFIIVMLRREREDEPLSLN